MHPLAYILILSVFSGEPASDRAALASFSAEGLISVIDEIEIPALREGRIIENRLQPGDEVPSGETIVRLDDRDASLRAEAAKFTRDAAKFEADSRLNIESAKLEAEQAWSEHQQNRELNVDSPGTIPLLEMRRLHAAAKQADLKIKQAEHDQNTALQTYETRDREWRLGRNEVADHNFVSPIDGVVVEVLRKEGEWVKQGDPVLRVARMDRFRVEGFFSASSIPPHRMYGRELTVFVRLPGEPPIVFKKCKVSYVSSAIEANGDCRFWVEVANRRVLTSEGVSRWLLRPGMLVELKSAGFAENEAEKPIAITKP